MQSKWSRTQTVTAIGTFVLGIALAGNTAVAQSPEARKPSVQKPLGQQMDQYYNQDIQDRLERRFARSSALAGSDINIAVADRTVALSGIVDSEQNKERALRLTRRTQGVREVRDELSVDKATVDKRRNVKVGDDELAKQIAMKLAKTFTGAEAEEEWFSGWEVEGYNWEFNVEVDEAVVSLEGDVGSYSDITEAIRTARAVPGVRAVESELTAIDSPNYRNQYYGR